MIKLSITAAILTTAAAHAATSITRDFSTAGPIGDFTEANGTNATNLSFNSGTGTNGQSGFGSLSGSGSDTFSFTTALPAISQGETLSLSIQLQATAANGTGAATPLGLRVGDNASLAAGNRFDFDIRKECAASTYSLRGDGTLDSDTFNLTTGTWYTFRLSMTLENAATGMFSVTGDILNAGSDGTGATLIDSFNAFSTFTSTDLAGASNLYVGFRAADDFGPGGATAVDNFAVSIVPEPSSGLLIAICLGGGLLRRRR